MSELWEILVPTMRMNGKPYHTRFHRVWDKKVRDITGGMTIMPVAKGQWVDPSNKELFHERMIPVRIMIENDSHHEIQRTINKIVNLTLQHYDDQRAIMLYRVSDFAIIRNR